MLAKMATIVRTMEPDHKMSARQTLTDLVLEFLEASVHEFQFAWEVYPKVCGRANLDNQFQCSYRAEAFEQRVLYDVPIHMSRYPLLNEYIHSMLAGCRTWLLRGELEKLCIVLLSEDGRTLETLVIEPSWSAAFLEATAGADEDHSLPLQQLEEAFRAGVVALVAAPANNAKDQKHNKNPNSFRILARTVEDATSREAAVSGLNAANTWVLADPFWCEDQQKTKEISPVKAIQSESSPVRLNVYMEKQQPAPVADKK